MLSLQELQLHLSTITSMVCEDTYEAISKLYGSEGELCRKTFEYGACSTESGEELIQPLHIIEKCLEIKGFCGVRIETADNDLGHVFTLVRIDNEIYRAESYIDCYLPKITHFPDYKEKLMSLFESFSLGMKGFIDVWNSLFSSRERQRNILYITIHMDKTIYDSIYGTNNLSSDSNHIGSVTFI